LYLRFERKNVGMMEDFYTFRIPKSCSDFVKIFDGSGYLLGINRREAALPSARIYFSDRV